MPLPYSFLDIVPILEGVPVAQSYRNMIDLAQRAERWGFSRYWLAEHHAHPGVASAATVVLITRVLDHTKTIRVGSGGIMLPNHAPLLVAEQFGALETLFPGRVDLGLGRAPGTDQRTAMALRRHMDGTRDNFPQDVMELLHYLGPAPDHRPDAAYVRAVPGEGLDVPVYILGSSLFGAELAATLGLPFAFASHFAPAYLEPAMALYREKFRPSRELATPHAIATMNVIAADDRARAQYLATTLQQHYLNLGRGQPQALKPPVEDITQHATPAELARLRPMLGGTIVGDRDDVRAGVQDFLKRSQADELLVAALIHDHEARCRSVEMAGEVIGQQ